MMSTAQCEPRIETLTGKGGLPMIRLTHSSGSTCEVYLFGATITSYCTPQGKEVLFVSGRSQFNGKKVRRGAPGTGHEVLKRVGPGVGGRRSARWRPT